MSTADFCHKYQITELLLDKAGLEYAELFRRIIANPPVSKTETIHIRRESRRDRSPPSKSIFICYSNRSGSSYLADLLTLAGSCGKPQEYFTIKNMERIARRFAAGSLEDYLRYIAARRQSDNGVFASKIGFSELIYLHRYGYLEYYFPNPYYIMLRREDSVMQAVSWYRAAYQKTWSSAHMKRAEAAYDVKAISHYYQLIANDARRWTNYFSVEGIIPLHLTYEDLLVDPYACLNKISRYLEIGSSLQVDPKGSRFNIQRDAISGEWAERFALEIANKI